MNMLGSPEWVEFLENVRKAKDKIGNPEIVWYRGHANEKFYLLPSLLRFENGIELERELFYKFKRFSDRVIPRKISDWETLFEMQHYEVPTRLLDWSETFGIALYFAAFSNNLQYKNENAAIYLLNPLELNKISGINSLYQIPRDENLFSYSKIYWEHMPFEPKAPIAIEPIFINNRMLAQRGMFIVYNDSLDAIEEKYPNVVQKVVINKGIIAAALEFLELSNINSYTVFPDVAGLSRFLPIELELKSRW